MTEKEDAIKWVVEFKKGKEKANEKGKIETDETVKTLGENWLQAMQ